MNEVEEQTELPVRLIAADSGFQTKRSWEIAIGALQQGLGVRLEQIAKLWQSSARQWRDKTNFRA